jgi:hypothetical protein
VSDPQPAGPIATAPIDARSEYTRRIARWNGTIAHAERRHHLVANLRLTTLAAFALIAWLAFSRALLSPAWMAAPVVGFAILAIVHARILHQQERAMRARRLYERGLERLDGRWAGIGPDGSRFLEGHNYALDLDLFGPASLFQLMNAAKTESGEDTLAAWLGTQAPITEVRSRQTSVVELAPQVDFREALAVAAADAHVGRTSALGKWASQPPAGLPWRNAVLFFLSGLTTAVLLVAAVMARVPASVAIAWLVFQGAMVLRWRTAIASVISRIDAASDDLSVFRELLETVEGAAFHAPRLQALHRQLVVEGALPSQRVSRLQALVSLLNQYQHNPYFRFVGVPLLIGGQLAVAIDRWHASYGLSLAVWIRVIGELEALSSLATYSYEHPADPFPVLEDHSAPRFEARGVAHPLLLESAAVRNDLRLGGADPHVYLVSGSNMSGKSTLLRAVGVNIVLALAGAPVRAERLALTPLDIGATLRISDSLQEGYSRFYAEILRIRSIVDLARGGRPVLFLLDEILHGTNSHDRRIGAEAIIRALITSEAIGLVTTHDLALTEVVSALGPLAANIHFEDQISEGQLGLQFDYRLRPGVVERSNALSLMRAIGLDV